MSLITKDGVPYFEFAHEGERYAIHIWLSDAGTQNVYQFGLNEIIAVSGGEKTRFIGGVIVDGSQLTIDNAGGVIKLMRNTFLPKVNAFLAIKTGEATAPSGFPEDKGNADQFNWIIENALEYVNGEIIINI